MMNMNLLVANPTVANLHLTQGKKADMQSVVPKQTGSFGDVFSQVKKTPSGSTKQSVKTTEQPSLIDILFFTEEEAIDYLSSLMDKEEVAQLLDLLENVPFMYQLEDVVKHLFNHLPTLEEWVEQNIVGKENISLDVVVDKFMEQITQLFNDETTLTEEEVSLFAALQPMIQQVLMKVDQTPKEASWLQNLQMIQEQKTAAPETLLQALFDESSEEVAKRLAAGNVFHHGQTIDRAHQSATSFLAQMQQSPNSTNQQPFHSLQAILQQMNTKSSEESQVKLEGVTSTGLTSKDAAGELAAQRFQLNLEQVPEAKRGEKLMQELQAMMKRANFGRTGGINRITVQVYPEQLGQIRIELQEHKGILTARILASVAMTKDLLERQMHQLRQALGQHTQVERIEIVQMLQETPRHEREQLFQQQQRQFQQQQAKKENKDDDEQTFEEFLAQLEEVELNE